MKSGKFINREEEISSLQQAYSITDAQMVVLYGRRRVGKTTLIEEFIRNKHAIYFVADKQTERDLMKRFQVSIAGSLNNAGIERLEFPNWDDLFIYWLKHENFKERVILVLDEFQYLAYINPAFPSILQRLWDQYFRHKNLMIILCGSLIHMMYQTTLSYQSPLYGRRTAQIRLEPVQYSYYKYFFPDLTPEKRLEFFAITGGVPRYIELLDPKKDIWENIENVVLSKQGYLYAEPHFILSQEVTEPINYFSILKAIAEGESKIGKIASKLGLKTNTLTKYLEMLINLGLIDREIPVTESSPNKSKMGLYTLKDEFFRFWFRYVFPNQSFLEIDQRAFVLKKIRDNFQTFSGNVYERVCRKAVPNLAINGIIPFIPDRFGRWWTRSTEIDIVAFKESTKEMLFGECKWTDNHVEASVYHELRRKSSEVPWYKGNRKSHFVIFYKKHVSQALQTLAKKGEVILIKGIP